MDIAVKYEKINLGNERYVFKPVGIIKGKYDSSVDTFETEYGDLCANIEGDSQFEDNYFGCHVTLDDLKMVYDKEGLTEEEMLMLYYDECTACICIGQFDYIENTMQIISIPFEDIDSVLETEVESYLPTENGVQIRFNLEALKKLREIDDIEKIREKLDEIIICAKSVEENSGGLNQSTTTREEKQSELNSAFALQKEPSKLITLKELRKEVKDVIKGQDKAVDAVTRAIIVNQMSNNPRHKSHMLITGPSGTGKTEMINIISKKLGIPYFKVDSPQYTSEGYVGKSVYSMLAGLLNAANNDLNKAEHGILIIDEIDKKLTEGVNGKEVLNAMLKMMDREIVEVDIGHGYQEKKVMFDTSNLTIIFMGAFAELYASKAKEKKRGIGFSSTTEKEEEKVVITNDDLIKAGMPAEFLGRIPVITSTEELDVEQLVEILYKSKGGTIDEEKEFFKDLGITVKFTNPYMREIAEKAHKTKTGARNLRKLVRESLAVAYDDILSGKKVKMLKLTKETAQDPKKYYTE